MINVLISGANGKMGQVISKLISENNNFTIVCGFDKNTTSSSFPIYSNIKDIKEIPDIIIDFSIPCATMQILDFAITKKIPIVIATTGLSENELNVINDASKKIPIFRSSNMSFDISIMKKLVMWLAPLLKNADIEIIETHHNRKIDSPSGTAQMLADSINTALRKY